LELMDRIAQHHNVARATVFKAIQDVFNWKFDRDVKEIVKA